MPGDKPICASLLNYLKLCMKSLPHQYVGQDSLSMVLAYFCVSGLDLIDAIKDLTAERKKAMIEWIYEHQILPTRNDPSFQRCGFRGSLNICGDAQGNIDVQNSPFHVNDTSHATMTYASLCCLVILGDDLARVDRRACVGGLAALQCDDGGFLCSLVGGEKDVRFIYSAVVSCYILADFSHIDTDRAVEYMLACQTYEGGFGSTPGLEAHGGPTYCVVASLALLGRLDSSLTGERRERLLRWCVCRCREGFHGRPDKEDDSCYTFWIGATLKILGQADLISKKRVTKFVMDCQCVATGGFSKYAERERSRGYADLMHSYLAAAGLACLGVPDLAAIRAPVNITERAHLHLLELHRQWKQQ